MLWWTDLRSEKLSSVSERRLKLRWVHSSHPLCSSPNVYLSTAVAVHHSPVQMKPGYETPEHWRLDSHLHFCHLLNHFLPIHITWAFFSFKPFMVLSGLSAFPLHLCHSRTLHNLKLHIFLCSTSGVGVIYTPPTIYSHSLIGTGSAPSESVHGIPAQLHRVCTELRQAAMGHYCSSLLLWMSCPVTYKKMCDVF